MMDKRYSHRWLLVLPFLWQVGAVPFVNDIAWRPFSLPFPMVWQLCGILLATAIIATVFWLDERVEANDGDEGDISS
ncbi:MAG: DUF3311 domain-containing protein [Hyphomicrobiales bacterium]|nr:MAG: DUF3311 domain-containing protein [Hyphomicrobiales bacterium]